jgi:hypothetical protein
MRSAEPAGGDSPIRDEYSKWVVEEDIPSFIGRMRSIRATPDPAEALKLLRNFATNRRSSDLITCAKALADSGGQVDAVNLMATAAIRRPADKAADLAMQLWHDEDADRNADHPLTASVIHDLAGQRMAFDVAQFIKNLTVQGLVDETLEIYVSNRSNLDKVLLYLALRDEGCAMQAAALLDKIMKFEGGREYPAKSPAAGPFALHDLVGALYSLSPAEAILPDWIEKEFTDPNRKISTITLIARLLADSAEPSKQLVDYISTRWSHDKITQICVELLTLHATEAFALVRARTAAQPVSERLAILVKSWWERKELRDTTEDLLSDFVTNGRLAAAPRSLPELDSFAEWLSASSAPAQCLRMLRMAAAGHVVGRTGVELAYLLHRIRDRRDTRRAAQLIGQNLRRHVLTGDIESSVITAYLGELRRSGAPDDPEAVYWVLKALTGQDRLDNATREPLDARLHAEEPEPVDALLAKVIADIGSGLYAENLGDDGWALLERCLENEQRVSPEHVAEIFRRLAGGGVPSDQRRLLIQSTVGRWSDVASRSDVSKELRAVALDEEADLISARY